MQHSLRRSLHKRRLRRLDSSELAGLRDLASKARYGGNPQHKRNPGDYDLHPPAVPRPAKSLCDAAEIFRREEAQALLREGLQRGLVSEQDRNGWPQNVWAVAPNGVPLEAMLENAEQGIYHGYPIPESDPFAQEVLSRWSAGKSYQR